MGAAGSIRLNRRRGLDLDLGFRRKQVRFMLHDRLRKMLLPGGEDGSEEALPALYDELALADQEHGDVAVVHEETGWSLSAHRDGRVVMEHLGDGGERHMVPVSREKVLDLWSRLVTGRFDELFAEPWKSGYT